MTEHKPYQVIITKSKGLNIILENSGKAQLRTYSHFVTLEDAQKFAGILESSLAEGPYYDADRCQLCGKPFVRQNRLCLLKDNRIIHKACFQKATKQEELSYSDYKEFWNHYFLQDAPEFNHNSLSDGGDRSPKFRYSIQTISKEVIHLCLIEPSGYMKHRFCLTYDESQGLIHEIRSRADQLKQYLDAVVGQCACCGNSMFVDDSYYVMATGELVHGVCMDRFIQSSASAAADLPARKILLPGVTGAGPRFSTAVIPSWLQENI